MAKIETVTRKSLRGDWSATTDITIGHSTAGRRELTINTTKSSSGVLVTIASVGHVKDGMRCWVVFQDFSKRIAATRPARCTSKVVEAQHAEALKGIDALIVEAKAHYEPKAVPA